MEIPDDSLARRERVNYLNGEKWKLGYYYCYLIYSCYTVIVVTPGAVAYVRNFQKCRETEAGIGPRWSERVLLDRAGQAR